MQVCIVALKKGQLQVLSNAWDENVGGREIDELIFNHFADEFKERYKIDVRTNTKASFRLRAAAEKVRAVPCTPLFLLWRLEQPAMTKFAACDWSASDQFPVVSAVEEGVEHQL